jgi:ribonucleotide reductase alpha subunit
MYYYAVEASCELAKERGTFEFYELSPYAEGKLHYDLYFDTASSNTDINAASSNLNASVRAGATAGEPILDWDALKANIKLYGMRNIQLIALMPTKSMAKITNTSESFHPIPHLIYRNKSSSGDVNEINKYLLDELKKRNLYSKKIITKIIADKSCQNIMELPEYFRKCFKTAFEYKQIDIMNMTIDRAPWVDQSQSFNQFFSTDKLDYSKYYTFLVKSNAGLLKTLSYYLVRPPPIEGSSMTDNENDCKMCSA